jgi:hypothetical protein
MFAHRCIAPHVSVNIALLAAHTIYPTYKTRPLEPRADVPQLVGWTASASDPGFGGRDDGSLKARLINLVSSVRTLMRSTYPSCCTLPGTPREWEGGGHTRSELTILSTAYVYQHPYDNLPTRPRMILAYPTRKRNNVAFGAACIMAQMLQKSNWRICHRRHLMCARNSERHEHTSRLVATNPPLNMLHV